MLKIEKIIKILRKEYKKYRKPVVTELSYRDDPFIVLISCLLSLRIKDKVTAIASKNLFDRARTPREILKLDLKEIERLIYPVGFYKTKAKRIKEICNVLVKNYHGNVPNKFEELLKLKGVGKKTASITMVYGFKNKDYIPVDVHIHMISNRLGWVKTKNPDKTMDELMKKIPKKYWYELNDLLVVFGQNVCVTVSPFCSKCGIRKYCRRIGVNKSR
ncbi:MAG: endonuclease III [archaeon]